MLTADSDYVMRLHQNYREMPCHQYIDTDQVSSLSEECNANRLLTRARSEGTFYENLVCIVLIIVSVLDIIKYFLTTCESTYIELIFHKKSMS